MDRLVRPLIVAALILSLGTRAGAQAERCTHEALGVDGSALNATFCVVPVTGTANLNVNETFTAQGKTLNRSTALAVVSGAQTSRTIDDVDLRPIGIKHSLHMTLAYRDGHVTLEHALAIPGAIPVK